MGVRETAPAVSSGPVTGARALRFGQAGAGITRFARPSALIPFPAGPALHAYGAKYSGASMDANRQAWENAALAAIAIEDSAGNSYIQPHTASVQQTTMTPVSY